MTDIPLYSNSGKRGEHKTSAQETAVIGVSSVSDVYYLNRSEPKVGILFVSCVVNTKKYFGLKAIDRLHSHNFITAFSYKCYCLLQSKSNLSHSILPIEAILVEINTHRSEKTIVGNAVDLL